MAKHFIHYLSREIKNYSSSNSPDGIAEPFYAEKQDAAAGFESPMYHITSRRSRLIREIEKDSIIWLFSILKSPWGVLPPALDAKFVVEKKEELPDSRTKFYASKESKWFPLYDATAILNTLKSVDYKGNERYLRSNPEQSFGIYLQSIRRLSNNHGLEEWSENILHTNFHFISYRIKDGTKYAFQQAEALVKSGKVVFWDKFSLPRRLVERRELVDNAALDNALMTKIIACYCVWGIETPLYFVPESYAQKEAKLAKQLNKYFPIHVA